MMRRRSLLALCCALSITVLHAQTTARLNKGPVSKGQSASAQHGREAAKGEVNFTTVANYLLAHPEPVVMREPENEDDDAVPARLAIPSPSLVHRRDESARSAFSSSHMSFLPVSQSPADTFESTIDNASFIPPDTHGGVDSNYCVTAINAQLHIQTRTGTNVSTVSLNSFFSSVYSNSGTFDPRVHYDPITHRWILVVVADAQATTSCILIAVSKTSNPTGAWWTYKILADGTGVNWLDYPDVGFNSKWIVVTGNLFGITSGYGGAKVFAFNKAAMMAGTGAGYTSFIETGDFTICPAITYDAAESSLFAVESYNGTGGYMNMWKIAGAVGSETLTQIGYPTTSTLWFDAANSGSNVDGFAPQRGSTNHIQTNDDRVTQVVQVNNNIWFAHTVFLPYSTTDTAHRSSVQWWETDTLANPIQVGYIDDATNTNFYAFPTIAVNANNDALIGFSAMSATTYASAGYALRMHTDPTDSIRPLQLYRHGQNSYYKTYGGTRNRWGDYSGTMVDPINGTDFWTIQEAAASTANTWDTWWANITVSCTPGTISGTTGICAGSTATLSETVSGGTWSSSNTAVGTVNSTGVVGGISAGTATITYTVSSGCYATATVTVNALPSAIAGTMHVCVGLTTALTDATTGGTWSSSNTSIATVGVTGIVTGGAVVTASTATITYTLPTGCITTAAVTVNITPSAILGTMHVCVGLTSSLTDATTGGTWSSSNTGVASLGSTSGIVSGVSAGTTIITYTLPTGCITTAVVTVNPLPSAILGNRSFCIAATTSLSDAATGGIWSSSNTAVGTIGSTTGLVGGIGVGTTTITYTLSTGCSISAVVTVNIQPSAITGALAICNGATTTLSDAVSGGVWSSSSPAVGSVNTTGVVSGLSAGTTMISYTVGTCYSAAVVTVTPSPTAILGTKSVCLGYTTSLSDAVTGGTWSSSYTSGATVTSSGIVTGVLAGTVVITYSMGTCYSTTVVTVVASPAAISGTLSACTGSTTTLTDAPTGGTWTSSNTAVGTIGSATGVISGLSIGTTTISYSLGGACISTAVVTVNTSPVAITGPTNVCVGATITNSDATGGGVWTSSNPAVGSVGAGTGMVTGVAAGTTTISYTLPSGCFTTLTVTVNVTPSAISGTTTVCTGLTTTLSDATTGGVWTSGNGTVATVVVGSGVVTGAAAGTASITYSLSTGCFNSTVVTVNTSPVAITGPTTVCVGATITNIDATGGGVWTSSTPAAATVGAGTGVVTGVAAGTTIISYTLSSGCYTTTVVTVNVTPPAISGTTTVCAGLTTTLSDATTGGFWTSGNGTVATVVVGSGVVTGAAAGTASITYSLSTGCFNSTVVTVNTSPAAITGPTGVCIGFTIPLSDAAGGGVWTSSTPAAATVVAATGVVTGVAAGTTIISYTLSSGCYTTVIVTVSVTASAGTITGAGVVCANAFLALSDAATGGTWSSTNTTIATIDITGVVYGVSAGTATISYTVSNGCGTVSATYVVTVNPAPNIYTATGGGHYCAGGSGVVIGLSNSDVGDTYQLYQGGTMMGSPVSGTGAAINFPLQTVAGSYGIVTTITATGCTGSNYGGAVVTIDSAATGGSIFGSPSVCQGATTTFTESATGGVWSSANTAVGTIGSATGVMYGVAAGTVTISYTVTNACGAASSTVVATVSSAPGAIFGSSPICTGSSVSFSDATAGGSWTSSAPSIASVTTTGLVSGGTSAGTAIISYTTGCSTATYPVTVVAAPNAGTITGTASACVSSTTNLTDAATGGSWSSGATGVATVGSTGIVTGVSGGTATISYTITNSCGSVSATDVVTVTAPPSAISGSSPICVNTSVSFSDATAGGSWTSSAPGIASVISTGLVSGGASPGTAIISYTTSCGTATYPVTVTATSTGTITGPATVTVGTSITLSDAVAGGTWSASNGNATVSGGLVTGVTAGTVVISYAVTGTCGTAYATKVITVNNATISAITGNTNICAGTTSTLSDATAGGTWNSSNSAVATVSGTSGVVSGIAAGTAYISYTVGTSSTSVLVTVLQSPTPIGGASSVCAGASVTLTDATSGGSWSSSNTNATIDASGNVAGATVGASTITYLLSDGCYTTYPMNVLMIPAPITGITTVCVGGTTTLTDTTSGGLSWTSSNTTVATTSGDVVTGVSTGAVTITYKITSGCYTTTVVNVSGATPAITGGGAICPGASLTLTDASGTGAWTSSNTTVATVGAASGVVTGAANGTASITYSPSGTSGCTATTVITVNPAAAISGATSVCAGGTITLSDATAGGTWSSSNGSIATVSSAGVVSGITTGSVTISYSLATGCVSTTNITVNMAPVVIVGSTSLCLGGTSTLMDATGGGVWSSSNTSVATIGSATGLLTGTGTSTATITYTAGGCYTTIVVTVSPVPSAVLGIKTVCVGSTVSLSDGTAGGTWSTTAGSGSVSFTGTATITVTGVSAGTAVMSYTTGTGCSATAVVTVNSGPAAIGGNAPVCVGSAITLTDAVGGGTWTSTSTTTATVGSATGIVTGVAAGVVVITYSTGGSCYATANVTVNATIGAITGLSTVCAGLTIALSDGTPGGAWSSSNPAAGTVSTTGVVTGIGAGTTNVTYAVSGCSRVVTITVNTAPPAINGSLSICGGTTTTLTDASLGGVWSLASSLIATIGSSTGLVTASSTYTGTTTVSYTLGGCPAIATLAVSSRPAPIQGATSECVGVTITLSDATAGGAWSSSNGDVSFGSTGGSPVSVTGVTAGASTITYSLGAGCYVTAANTVYANPGPITGPTMVCTGLTITLSDATAGGAWTSSAPAVASASGYTITGLTAGTAIITYKITTGSCIATQVVTVNTSPVVTTISGPTSISHATPATLSDATAGGVWTSNHTAVISLSGSTGSPVTATAVATSGTATISYAVTTAAGCTTTVIKNITATPAPPPHGGTGTTTLFAGATVSLFDDVATGLWASSDNGIATVDNYGTVTGVNPGIANITHTITNSGDVTTNVTTIEVTALPMNVSVIPNPNKGTFTVNGTMGSTQDEEVTLEVTDVLGQAIYKNKLTAQGGKLNEVINLGTLANGMYLLNVHSTTGNKAIHFVIEQ